MSENNWKNRLEQLSGRFSGHTFLGLDADNKASSGDAMTVLSHESITSISGPDTVRFLQGQLTCDINQLASDHFTLGASCTPKGRMVANFRALNHDNRILLTMPAETTDSQHDALKAHLGKYIVFYKAEISDASSEWLRIGIFGDNCDASLSELCTLPASNQCSVGDDYLLMRLSGSKPRYELWLQPEAIEKWWQQLTQLFTVKPSQSWQLKDIQEGIAWVTPAIRESYIPQHFNLQALEGVSFKKGCYTGQEIVARMQYLGKLKSRLYRLTGSLPELPEPGTKLFMSSTGKSVGEVISAAHSNSSDGIELLAVIRSDSTDDPLYTESHNHTPISVASLPYNI